MQERVFELAADDSQCDKESDGSPEGPYQRAADPVAADMQHTGCIWLYTLERRDRRVKQGTLPPAEPVDQDTEPHCQDRAQDPLPGKRKAGRRDGDCSFFYFHSLGPSGEI